jgi:membrane protein implicated in regulation of membrane protease activity
LFSARTILKYTTVHLAELVLLLVILLVIRYVIGLPSWVMITVLLLSILKDVILFPKVWRAYARGDNRPISELMGLEATVAHSIDPVGYVRVRGELWKAEAKDPRDPVVRGERTRVVGGGGMRLVVERLPQAKGAR